MFKFIKEYKELKHLAYHDSLTGLLNRNWLYKYIDKIDCQHVYFVDINDLKSVNKLGHTYGDKYIVKIIEKIKLSISDADIFCRYAGDEFILFSNTEDLLKTNKDYSVGYSYHGSSYDLKLSINIADREMINSKKQFKNKSS